MGDVKSHAMREGVKELHFDTFWMQGDSKLHILDCTSGPDEVCPSFPGVYIIAALLLSPLSAALHRDRRDRYGSSRDRDYDRERERSPRRGSSRDYRR